MKALPVARVAVAAALLTLAPLAVAVQAQTSVLGVAVNGPEAEVVASTPAPAPAGAGDAFGISGALRALVVNATETLDLPWLGTPASGGAGYRWLPLLGTSNPALLGAAASPVLQAPSVAGIWQLQTEQAYATLAPAAPLTLITRVPFSRKRNGYLNGYHIGTYPAEGSGRSDRYAPPSGFIEVTAENQDLHISEHFQLRQFLTKDQRSVWPKYLALDLRLIDKLELVLQELNNMGVRADRMHVMSGYRTPQYNGPGEGGRARLSRHTYGDAADVWVDSDGDGYIDDLNGDGRADLADVRVMMRAVDRVEQRYPELVGGAGIYNANSAHGPFIHIDVRGSRARW